MTTEQNTATDKPRVLIADDDPTMRLLASLVMQQAGFDIIEAADGAQALERLKESLPDLVMLDVTMPVMDGYAACAALRQFPDGDRVPVIIITGLDDVESINRAYDAGATDFITKPINWTILRHRVRYIMRASRAMNDLWENQMRLANAQRVAELGDWDWDLKRSRFGASEQVFRILGKTTHITAASLETLMQDVHGEDLERVREAVSAALERGQASTLDHRILLPGGQVRFVHHQVEPSRTDESGRAVRLVGTMQDITKRKHIEERIRQLAYFDALTGLPNRLLLNEQLRNAVALAARNGSQIALMFLDLDGFKRVNDTLGHDAGDTLLRTVASRLAGSVRTTDSVGRLDADDAQASVARLGGDEFVVLLSAIKQPEDATTVARRILHVLAEPMQIGGQDILVSCSIGIALYPQDGDTSDSLLMNADAAMYRAKASGRNAFQYYDRSMNALARERLALESDLLHAIERNELELLYQPKLDVATGRIIGAEAMLHWRHPERGLICPYDALDLSRHPQLLVPIEEWVVRTACRAASAWPGVRNARFSIAINLSGPYLRRGELLPTLERVLGECALPARHVEIEVAAAVLIEDAEATRDAVQRLRDAGIRFTVDEFGAGYASLPQLKRLPIESLKIDRSFVIGVAADRDDAAICGSIVHLAHGLGLAAVAEGVETTEQLEALRRLGCDQYQGPLVSALITAEEMALLLERSVPAVA